MDPVVGPLSAKSLIQKFLTRIDVVFGKVSTIQCPIVSQYHRQKLRNRRKGAPLVVDDSESVSIIRFYRNAQSDLDGTIPISKGMTQFILSNRQSCIRRQSSEQSNACGRLGSPILLCPIRPVTQFNSPMILLSTSTFLS